MKRGQNGQLGLAEAFMAKGLGSNARLEKITGLVDWPRFDGLLSKVRPGLVTSFIPMQLVIRSGSMSSAFCTLATAEFQSFCRAWKPARAKPRDKAHVWWVSNSAGRNACEA